jgi:hypothetical protein
VHLIPTDTVEPFVFRARLAEYLGESTSAQLQYYRVSKAPLRPQAPSSPWTGPTAAGTTQPPQRQVSRRGARAAS